ncbi:MAG TPA: CPBP family intramembrane glutamic endopeptidase [Chthoniobacterales bacterium]
MNREIDASTTPAWSHRVELVLLCLISLGLITTTNGIAYSVAQKLAPSLTWLAETCIASLIVCVVVYLSIRPARPFAMPRPDTDWRRVLRLSSVWLVVWLLGSAARAAQVGHWVAYAHGAAAIAAFLIFGPLQEEFLFRGAIFELAKRAFPSSRAFLPILISSVFFSLHHFELHGYRATPAALLQVGFTFPMGIVFGALRSESGSLWPALILHFFTNLPGCFGS